MSFWKMILAAIAYLLGRRAGEQQQAQADQTATNQAVQREQDAARPSTDDDTINAAKQGKF